VARRTPIWYLLLLIFLLPSIDTQFTVDCLAEITHFKVIRDLLTNVAHEVISADRAGLSL
jgi:hypothetical protein